MKFSWKNLLVLFGIIILFYSNLLPIFALTENDETMVKDLNEIVEFFASEEAGTASGEQLNEMNNKRAELIRRAVNKAMNAENAEEPDSLLAELLSQKEIILEVLYQISCNQKDFSDESLTLAIAHALAFAEKNKSFGRSIIRSIIINFPDSSLLDSESQILFEKIILTNPQANVMGLVYLPEISKEAELQLIEIAKSIDSTQNGWVRNWLALCILGKLRKGDYLKRSIEHGRKLVKIEDSWNWIWVPAGLAFTEQPEAIQELFQMLDSEIGSKEKKNTDPPRIQLAHEAATALSWIIKDFPSIKYYDKFEFSEKQMVKEWRNEHENKFQIMHRNLRFYLTETRFQLL